VVRSPSRSPAPSGWASPLSSATWRRLARGGRSGSQETPGSKPKLGESARRLLEADLEERPEVTLS